MFLYAVLCLFTIPQIGMSFSPFDGEVFSTIDPSTGVRPGDRVVAINGFPFTEYGHGSRPPLTSLLGDKAEYAVTLDRDGQIIQRTIQLKPPGFEVFVFRLMRIIPAFFFLYSSLILLLSLRPINVEWFLGNTAIQIGSVIIAASTAERYNLLYSPDVLRIGAWIAQPIFLHLGIFFPRPVARISQKVMIFIYLAFFGLAAAERLQLLPGLVFGISLAVTVVTTVTLLVAKRWSSLVLLGRNSLAITAAIFVVAAPLISVIFTNRFDSPITSNLYIYSLTLIPIASVYTVHRHVFNHLELRINRELSFFFYTVVLLTGILLIYAAVNEFYPQVEVPLAGMILLILVTAVISAWLYPRFQRMVEVHILKIPLYHDQLIHTYAGRIGTSLEAGRLSVILVKELFPSILVRQAALLRLGGDRPATPIVLFNVTESMLPGQEQLHDLLERPMRFLPYTKEKKLAQVRWVRLVIPLTVEGRAIGVALFGRRDPDDNYNRSEIPTLVSLMDQTALALHNIDQAERLRQFHLANIERQEAERKDLARELHDFVLGEMALMVAQLPEDGAYQRVFEMYHNATGRIRSIVHGLRPTMIRFGLREAVLELASDLSAGFPNPPRFEIQIEGAGAQYPQEMETHVFRIIQQACHNALLHGKGSRIAISGTLTPDLLDIRVEDNGCGFEIGPNPDFDDLLENRHFGLAGMYERALLIGADFHIHSTPGEGTSIEVHWSSGSSDRPDISTG